MKRATVALLLTAAVLFLGAGCPDRLSSNETDGASAQAPPAPPPVEALGTEATSPDAASTEPDDGGAGSDATDEAGQETPSMDEEPQGVDDNDPAAGQEPEAARKEFLPESDDQALERADLEDLDNWGLTLARNEIFARHGRTFENPDIRAHFEGLSWYSPNPDYDNAWLSATELANADLILKYQKLKYDIPAMHP